MLDRVSLPMLLPIIRSSCVRNVAVSAMRIGLTGGTKLGLRHPHHAWRDEETMPYRPPFDFPDTTFHVVNRAIHRQLLCRDFSEYLAHLRILSWAVRVSPIDLFALCLMPNHFHLLVRAATQRDLAKFMHRFQMTHAMKLREWRGTVGCGAVYQSRYRASRVHEDSYFYRAVRYVERNPVRAKLTGRPDEWMWSSASPVAQIQGIQLAEWPLPRPENWTDFVNQIEPESELALVRRRTARREPLIDPAVEALTPAIQLAGVAADSDED
jgi:putative transposase